MNNLQIIKCGKLSKMEIRQVFLNMIDKADKAPIRFQHGQIMLGNFLLCLYREQFENNSTENSSGFF